MTRRVAAIDCGGTNSIRLLVADVDPGRGTLTDVDRRMEIVRLGQGVDTTGLFAPKALDRTLAALSDYASVMRPAGGRGGLDGAGATSATRDAANAGEFTRRVTDVQLGTGPEVLSGDEEAGSPTPAPPPNWPGRRVGTAALPGRRYRRWFDRVRPRRHQRAR